MTTANDRGDYRIYGIAAGRYYVLAGNDLEPRRPVIAGNPNAGPVQDYLVYYPGVIDLDHAAMIEVKPAADSYIDMRVNRRQEHHIRRRVIDGITGHPPDAVEFSLALRQRRG